MQLATLLTLKAFIQSLEGGQNESTVKNFLVELDKEISIAELTERTRIQKVFRRSDIVDVEVIEGSALGTGKPPEPFQPTTC